MAEQFSTIWMYPSLFYHPLKDTRVSQVLEIMDQATMNFLLQVEEEVQSQADCPRWGAGGTRWLKAGLSRHGVLAEKQRGAVLTWAQALVLWGRRCTSLTNPLPHLTQHRVNKHDTNF